MKLSKRFDYAIRAVAYLSRLDGCVPSGDISRAENIPPKFLESIMATLRKAGIIESKVGANGGYRLAKRGPELTAKLVFEAIEGTPEDVTKLTRGTVISTALSVSLDTVLGSFDGECFNRGEIVSTAVI